MLLVAEVMGLVCLHHIHNQLPIGASKLPATHLTKIGLINDFWVINTIKTETYLCTTYSVDITVGSAIAA